MVKRRGDRQWATAMVCGECATIKDERSARFLDGVMGLDDTGWEVKNATVAALGGMIIKLNVHCAVEHILFECNVVRDVLQLLVFANGDCCHWRGVIERGNEAATRASLFSALFV